MTKVELDRLEKAAREAKPYSVIIGTGDPDEDDPYATEMQPASVRVDAKILLWLIARVRNGARRPKERRQRVT